MNKKILVAILVVIVVAVGLAHLYMSDRGRWTTPPEYTDLSRSVTQNVLVSQQDPAVTMRFDPAFRYLGGQKFILYGVANTEQHFFVETTADDKLKSFYWIQFEAYLDDNSYTYDYDDSPIRLDLGNFEFFTDTAAVLANPANRRRGTDGALAREFAESKGYSFPQNYAYARLVHLTDASRRKELMVIFIEDLAPFNLVGADLQADGIHADRWPQIESDHLDKIRRTMTLLRVAD